MYRAVANSTSLSHLVLIGQFPLLEETFDQVCIPPAVWRDLVDRALDGRQAHALQNAVEKGWLQVVAPADGTLVSSLEQDLPDSDAEAIALAAQERPDAVLLDRASVIGLLIQAGSERRFLENPVSASPRRIRHLSGRPTRPRSPRSRR